MTVAVEKVKYIERDDFQVATNVLGCCCSQIRIFELGRGCRMETVITPFQSA